MSLQDRVSSGGRGHDQQGVVPHLQDDLPRQTRRPGEPPRPHEWLLDNWIDSSIQTPGHSYELVNISYYKYLVIKFMFVCVITKSIFLL